METRTRDMTQDSPARLLPAFALPLMFRNVFRHLYTVADTAIAGRYVGVEALAAPDAADRLHWLIEVSAWCGGALSISLPII